MTKAVDANTTGLNIKKRYWYKELLKNIKGKKNCINSEGKKI